MGLLDKLSGALGAVGAAAGPAGLAIGAIGSIGQLIGGAARASKAKKALENFQRQELINVAEGLKVSTLGAQLQTKQAARDFATSVEALRSGGVRALGGNIEQQQQRSQAVAAQQGAQLDAAQKQIDAMKAQDQANIRTMQEQRDDQEIAGMAAELASGRQAMASGVTGLMQTGMAAYQMSQPEALNKDTGMTVSQYRAQQQGGGTGGSNLLGSFGASNFNLGGGNLNYSQQFRDSLNPNN